METNVQISSPRKMKVRLFVAAQCLCTRALEWTPCAIVYVGADKHKVKADRHTEVNTCQQSTSASHQVCHAGPYHRCSVAEDKHYKVAVFLHFANAE